MYRINLRTAGILLGLSFMIVIGGTRFIHSKSPEGQIVEHTVKLPITIAHKGSAQSLDRPAVAFDHDRHTNALKQKNTDDCAGCHVVKETSGHSGNAEIRVFKFPKAAIDTTDKSEIMYAYHTECVNCHKKMLSEGKKSGPKIGLCGKCHDKRTKPGAISWAWRPIFNYARHTKHSESVSKLKDASKFNVAGKVEILDGVSTPEKKCEICHHVYDEKRKTLFYKKDTENACSACHKSSDQKNARSMKNVAHSACIGCHMKMTDQNVKESLKVGGDKQVKLEEKKTGPIDCKGCHGEHKATPLQEIAGIPRLERGQKNVMDLSLPDKSDGKNGAIPGSRMKGVPYNHKAHEPRVQFCNTCHHHSLEKCSNCHTVSGDLTKGGGVTYERAFHLATAKESCAGCHTTSKKDKTCSGCHQWMSAKELPQSSCPVCHKGPPEGKLIEAPIIPLSLDKEKVPEKVMIKTIEKEFKPVDFPHAKIANKLNSYCNNSSLARTFHAPKGEMTLCLGCHHRLESSGNKTNKFPTCATCHSRPFDPKDLGKVGILGAYHRQCVGCHEAMNQKPLALECVKCHAEKQDMKKVEMPATGKGN